MSLVHSVAQEGSAVPSQTEADDSSSFLRRVSEVPQTELDLEYLAVNVLFGRGALSKAVRRDAVVAVKTLRAILKDARRLNPTTTPPDTQVGTSACASDPIPSGPDGDR